MDMIDSQYGVEVNKRASYYVPLRAGDITLTGRGAHPALKKALEELSLKDTIEAWSYDHKGLFSSWLNDQARPSKFTTESRPNVEAHANPTEDGPFQSTGMVVEAVKPKWRAFYQAVATHDGSVTSLGHTINKHIKEQEYYEAKKRAFIQFRVETGTRGAVFENPMDVQWEALYDEEFPQIMRRTLWRPSQDTQSLMCPQHSHTKDRL